MYSTLNLYIPTSDLCTEKYIIFNSVLGLLTSFNSTILGTSYILLNELNAHSSHNKCRELPAPHAEDFLHSSIIFRFCNAQRIKYIRVCKQNYFVLSQKNSSWRWWEVVGSQERQAVRRVLPPVDSNIEGSCCCLITRFTFSFNPHNSGVNANFRNVIWLNVLFLLFGGSNGQYMKWNFPFLSSVRGRHTCYRKLQTKLLDWKLWLPSPCPLV